MRKTALDSFDHHSPMRPVVLGFRALRPELAKVHPVGLGQAVETVYQTGQFKVAEQRAVRANQLAPEEQQTITMVTHDETLAHRTRRIIRVVEVLITEDRRLRNPNSP